MQRPATATGRSSSCSTARSTMPCGVKIAPAKVLSRTGVPMASPRLSAVSPRPRQRPLLPGPQAPQASPLPEAARNLPAGNSWFANALGSFGLDPVALRSADTGASTAASEINSPASLEPRRYLEADAGSCMVPAVPASPVLASPVSVSHRRVLQARLSPDNSNATVRILSTETEPPRSVVVATLTEATSERASSLAPEERCQLESQIRDLREEIVYLREENVDIRERQLLLPLGTPARNSMRAVPALPLAMATNDVVPARQLPPTQETVVSRSLSCRRAVSPVTQRTARPASPLGPANATMPIEKSLGERRFSAPLLFRSSSPSVVVSTANTSTSPLGAQNLPLQPNRGSRHYEPAPSAAPAAAVSRARSLTATVHAG